MRNSLSCPLTPSSLQLHGFLDLFRTRLEEPYMRLLTAKNADAAGVEW